jgi:AraC-like DNA-binding protein
MPLHRDELTDFQMYTTLYDNVLGGLQTGGVKCRLHKIGRPISLHLHDYYEVELVLRGEMQQSVNGVALTSHAGDFVFMDLLSAQRIQEPTNPPEVWTLSISHTLADPAISRLLSRQRFPCVGHLDAEALAEFDRLAAELCLVQQKKPPYAEERCTALTVLLLTILMENGGVPDAPSEEPRAHHYVQKALLYLAEHFGEPLTLSGVAAEIHISSCYLSDLFSRIVGCRFVEYLTRLRLRHAQTMLASHERSVLDIATACGFGTASNFTRAFRRFCGVAPSVYRREVEAGKQ